MINPGKIHLLRLKVRDKLFSKSDDLKIKCTAAIDTIYWRSNEESIQGLSERSYNLNIRDNGWNSGGFYLSKKCFISPKNVSSLQKVFYLSKNETKLKFFLLAQCRRQSRSEVPLRQCRSSPLSLAGPSFLQGEVFSNLSSLQGEIFFAVVNFISHHS